MTRGVGRRVAAEAIGTALLLTAVVGSGIMAERLAADNLALALLANSLATGGALVALILTFTPISGAHLNPAVTLALAAAGQMRARDVVPYLIAQIAGAIVGVCVAHVMFALPIIQLSVHQRSGVGQWVGEFIATFGLLAVIESGRRHFVSALPFAIAAYITGAYWSTSSTSFANPAVTLARSLTDSFAGIDPSNVPAFVAAQAVGALSAVLTFRWLDAST